MKTGGTISGVLVFLACAVGVIAANPVALDIFAMSFGAAHYTVTEADGATRAVIHGPKGPWPSWAPAPGGAAVRPAASYAAAPGHPAQGFGEAMISSDPLAEAFAVKAALERTGWTVTEQRMETVEPTLPPRRLVICSLRAERSDPVQRTLLYGFEIEPARPKVRIHWLEGVAPQAQPVAPSAC